MIRTAQAYLALLLCVLSLLCLSPAHARDSQEPVPVTPQAKQDGSRWRLGYVGSGVFSEYPLTLRAMVDGLVQLGWMELDEPMPKDLEADVLWRWLAKHTHSDYLTFVADATWRPGNFDSDKRAPMRKSIQTRLDDENDVDLIIAMGTWAGQDMRELGPPVPTIVASTSDAQSAGIVDSIQDSGRDNLHARIEPQRYQRQVRLFHDIVPFQSLGIVYDDTETGRVYAAVDDIDQVSSELDFDVVACHATASDSTPEQTAEDTIACYQELADKQVDAVYVTFHSGVTKESIKPIARILRKASIPSFSMAGAGEVEAGILFSMATANVSYVGLFHAEAIARVFNGALPRNLDQVWVDPAKIALNLGTARIIGFDPPIDILLAADEVYESALEEQ